MKVVTILVRDHKWEKKFSIKLDSPVFSLYNSEKGKKNSFGFMWAFGCTSLPLCLRFLLLFFFSASCTVYGTWTVHLGLWIVTCTVHARELHCTRDIVHCSCIVYAQFTRPTTTLFKKILKMGPPYYLHF